MDICSKLEDICGYAIVLCQIVEQPPQELSRVAALVGLFGSPDIYHEIDLSQAQAILYRLCLRCILPADAGQALSREFFGQFAPTARYYTNGNYYADRPDTHRSATDSTFDTGILVISPNRVGCFWVEGD